MKTKILTAIAFLFAIPTYGISIVLWIIVKYQYDKICATRVLINAAVASCNHNGKDEIRYAINNAALPLMFSIFGGKINYESDGFIKGTLPHPITRKLMTITMKQLSENKLLINAKCINENRQKESKIRAWEQKGAKNIKGSDLEF